MKQALLTTLLLILLSVLPMQAQRRSCIRHDNQTATRAGQRRASVSGLVGEVRIPVILAAFQDKPFTIPDIRRQWEDMLNQSGYSGHGAQGCAADYFRKQSNGRFNITFDVIGPVTLPNDRAYYGANNNAGDDLRPGTMVTHACEAAGTDFSPYDWDGDGYADVVGVIYAGPGENKKGVEEEAIWPHMSRTYGKVGNISIGTYFCTCELLISDTMDGFGPFVHELSHTFGLPDLYPMTDYTYSLFDTWDVMDGGCFNNGGFSPPNYSAFERSLCGWYDGFLPLREPQAVTAMPYWDDQPVAYKITSDSNPKDYYILENRQQAGWDAYVPGQGLIVTHVNGYTGTLTPNQSETSSQVTLVAADGRSYEAYEAALGDDCYDAYGRCLYLSGAAFPFATDSTATVDAVTLFDSAVTDIRLTGSLVSFSFSRGSTAVEAVSMPAATRPVAWYDMNGRRLAASPTSPGVYIVRLSDGTTRKQVVTVSRGGTLPE